jgi:hypothetical protein
VQQRSGDLLHAHQHDAGALFYCQRMIGGLQLDEGPLTDGLGVDAGLQGERRRLVQRQVGGQPTEERLLPFPSGGGPQRQGTDEVVAAQRHPDSPVELGTRSSVGNRDDEASPDEEMLGLDNALLLFQRARLVTSQRRVPVGRGICPVRHWLAASTDGPHPPAQNAQLCAVTETRRSRAERRLCARLRDSSLSHQVNRTGRRRAARHGTPRSPWPSRASAARCGPRRRTALGRRCTGADARTRSRAR